MYTTCPHCGSSFRVTADILRRGGGTVRCGHCQAAFNALLLLRDGPAGPDQGSPRPENDARVRAQGGAAQNPRRARDGGAPAPEVEAAPEGQGHRASSVVRAPGSALFAALTLSLRNLNRDRRRTALGLAAIGFGVVALILAGGFIDWIYWAMRESTIQSRLGHAQVVKTGYYDHGSADPFGYLLPEIPGLLGEIESMPGVRVVAPRLAFGGLISHGDHTVPYLGEGVDPKREEVLSRHLHVTPGENLDPEDPDGVILGFGLARLLGVGPGDRVILLATTAAGGTGAIEVAVRGLFHTSTKAYDDAALRISLEKARELLRVGSAHAWVVLLEETEAADELVSALRARLGGHAADLQVVPWLDLADFYRKTVRLFSSQMDLVRAIIAVIIVLSISNLLVMSVLDRTSEIGTLMAIGLKRRRVLGLFLREGVLLGIVGGTVGVVVGWLLAVGVSWVGIPMPPPPGMESGFTGEIRVTVPLLTGAWTLAVITTALAGIYPAWRASRMNVVDALRHSR